MKTAIDILILIILVHGIWSGYKKGLIMGVAGALVLIVSVYGANLLADTFSYDVVPALKPFAGGFVEGQVDAEEGVLADLGWENEDNYSLEDLLAQHSDEKDDFAAACFENLGIDASAAKVMADSALEYAEEEEQPLIEAVIHELCSRISYVGCFILAFLMIAIILTVVINLPNLSYKIPHLDLVNDISGIIIGLLTAAAYTAVLVWALKFTGMIIGGEALNESVLGGWFLEKDFLARFLGV
ncbi:MAG: hypothetical protein IJY96_00540 [Oscillospiraceae bacterium]|nr:hypothetical protein [Oscillospiraceae bacterium]